MKSDLVDELEPLVARADARAWGEVAELIRAAGGYRWVGLYLVTDTEIRAVAWTGPVAPAFPRFPREKGLNGIAVSTKAPVICQDVSKDWFVVSFHTAEADQLIEELATNDTNPDDATTQANVYAGRLAR